MSGKILLIALTLLTACADPKYVSRPGASQPFRKAEAEHTQFDKTGTSLWLSWETKPTADQYGSLLLKTGRENAADKSPVPLDLEGDIAVILWMPSMGHGSSPVTVTKIDTGTYRATKVFFSMPGDWEIRVQRVVKGALIEQAVLPFRF